MTEGFEVSKRNGQIHNQVNELLSAYLDGEVTSDERALVETHLAMCAACAYDLATLRQTVSLLQQLPQVAASRPFTLREVDIRPVRPARPAWRQLSWARGLAAAVAVMLCVVVAAGVWWLGRPGMLGAPAAPAPVAMQAPAATEAPAQKIAPPPAVEAEKEVEVTQEVQAPLAAVVEEAATEAVPSPAAAPQATPELLMAQEMPAEAAPAQAEALADTAQAPGATAAARTAAGGLPQPTATPEPMVQAMKALSPTLLLQVEDLKLTVEPGIIRVSGRLPLPEGRKLTVELWREGQLIEWAALPPQPVRVGRNGQFSLELQALPQALDADLFAAPPANYELRLRPVDPPEPVEARIPFDTYGPPSALPTNTP